MQKLDRLGRLNAYQIAGIAMLCSAATAVSVLVILRRTILRSGAQDEAEARPPTDHFSQHQPASGFDETDVF